MVLCFAKNYSIIKGVSPVLQCKIHEFLSKVWAISSILPHVNCIKLLDLVNFTTKFLALLSLSLFQMCLAFFFFQNLIQLWSNFLNSLLFLFILVCDSNILYESREFWAIDYRFLFLWLCLNICFVSLLSSNLRICHQNLLCQSLFIVYKTVCYF